MNRSNFLGISSGKLLILTVLVLALKGHLTKSVEPTTFESNIEKKHSENHFIYGLSVIPHPSKRAKGGEDSYFVDENILAVADGVGGWNEVGVDPAKYSRELCQNVKKYWGQEQSTYISEPKELIIAAADHSKSQGSSTLCMVTLEKTQPVLNGAYIGDSGYVIFSFVENTNELKLVYESPEQTKGFNFPYQIGNPGDSPTSALSQIHEVKHNDIVVVGSDGLFDNVENEMIREILQKAILDSRKIGDIKKTCLQLGNLAYSLSLDKNHNSPFAQRAAQYGHYFRGGKSDDITIAIGQINLKQNNNEL